MMSHLDPNSKCSALWIYYNYITSTVLCVTGFLYICLGALLAGVKYSNEIVVTNVTILGFGLILFGLFLFILSTYGCIITTRECLKCLVMYCIALIVVIFVEAAVAHLALTYGDDYEKRSKKTLEILIFNYHRSSSEKEKEVVDRIQQIHSCCGVDSPGDWNINTPMPQSCCHKSNKTVCGPNSKHLYLMGCLEPTTGLVLRGLHFIASLSIVCAILERTSLSPCD
ncbi:tetraspanin-14-like isoform X2 [Ischnura elegans]|uniref:tetraspanin-14-like isoform X2 n=1 Tax=Ischnura elegans TaxID=197161 RepID=UPI001ED86BCC|nr:tetraspanin-14-like isoform X2 [Ischnura elegans]